MNILVTGAGGPAGINSLRLLSGIPNVQGYGVDMDPLSVGRTFAKDFRTISSVAEREAYTADLLACIRDWQIDVVLPTVTEELTMIRLVLLGASVKIVLSTQSFLECCADKRALYRWMDQAHPVLQARWITLDRKDALWEASQFFLKPAFGRGGRGCRLVRPEEVVLLSQTLPNPSEWILMEHLPGKEYTVDVYVDSQGTYSFVVPRERLALSGGISSKGKTLKDQDLIHATEEVLTGQGVWGPVCVQWKRLEDGRLKLLEINPRMSGAVMITAAAGANPMHCLVQDLEKGAVSTPVVWKEVTVLRYLTEILL